MDVLDFASNTGFQSLLAGAAIVRGDILAQDTSGEFWPIDVTNFAAGANAGSTVFADKIVDTQNVRFIRELPFLADVTNGRSFVVVPNSGSTGCAVQIYGPDGTLLITVPLSTSGDNLNLPNIRRLPAGNYMASWVDTTALQFAIIDQNGKILKAMTAVELPVGDYGVTTLSATGGFMFSYAKNGTLNQRVATYAADGSGVTAPTTIKTWVGAFTGGRGVITQLIELSSGEVGALFESSAATDVGWFYCTLTAAGAVDHAFTLLSSFDAAAGGSLAASAGFWAVAYASASSVVTFNAFSNAGASQGTPLVQTVISATENHFSVSADSAQFYFTYTASTTSYQTLAIGTNGATVETYVPMTDASTIGTLSTFAERGRLVMFFSTGSGTTSWSFAALNVSTGLFDTGPTQVTTPVAIPGEGKALPCGDFSFMALYTTQPSGNQTHLQGVKYVDTAVQGVAVAAASVGSAAYARSGAKGSGGVVQSTTTKPGTNVDFDHSSSNIRGNKGSMSRGGVSLQGLGIAA